MLLKWGPGSNVHSPFLALDWTRVPHILLKDIFGLNGNKSIPTIKTTPPRFRLIQAGQYSQMVKSGGSGTNCPALPLNGYEILD